MKHLCTCLIVLRLAVPALAQDAALKEARQRWLKGNHEEARTKYETLAKDAKHKVAASIGLSRVWQSQGDYDKALAVLDEALKEKLKDAADVHARRAEVLYLRGRCKDAENAAEE